VSDFRDDLVSWLDRRLDRVLAAPPTWGSPEAVELSVLQLLQVRVFARPARGLATPGELFDAYVAYLRQRFPRQPQRPLFELVGEDDEAYSNLADGLRGFIETIRRRTSGRRRPPSLAPSERPDWLAAAAAA
jgi:hypothetical protein